MMVVKNIMTSPVHTIDPYKSVFQASEYMQKHNLGGLPVLENNVLVGILTSSNIRLSHPNRIIADSMTKPVFFCSPADTLWDAAGLMEKEGIERLPVVDNGNLVGILTRAALMKYIGQFHDPLTGINNSHYIYQVANRLLLEGHEISVALFDINNFGRINKEMGHVLGDRCLKIVADIICRCVEDECDYLCRYGGDEFVIVSLKKIFETETMVDKIIDQVANDSTSRGIPISISAGISGGQRKHARETNCIDIVKNLINMASLASTRAKEHHKKYIIFN